MNPDAAAKRAMKTPPLPSPAFYPVFLFLTLPSVVSSASALQAGQWDPRRGGRIRHHPASGKVAQLHLAHLHPSPHPHLPRRVGGPLTADHHYSSCTGGLSHLLCVVVACHMSECWPQGQQNPLFIFCWATPHTLHHYVSTLLIKCLGFI